MGTKKETSAAWLLLPLGAAAAVGFVLWRRPEARVRIQRSVQGTRERIQQGNLTENVKQGTQRVVAQARTSLTNLDLAENVRQGTQRVKDVAQSQIPMLRSNGNGASHNNETSSTQPSDQPKSNTVETADTTQATQATQTADTPQTADTADTPQTAMLAGSQVTQAQSQPEAQESSAPPFQPAQPVQVPMDNPADDINRLVASINADDDDPGMLDDAGENITTTHRVLTHLGHEQEFHNWPHLNVNTEGDGVVYLRGYVRDVPQRELAELIASRTDGVKRVVNLLEIEDEMSG